VPASASDQLWKRVWRRISSEVVLVAGPCGPYGRGSARLTQGKSRIMMSFNTSMAASKSLGAVNERESCKPVTIYMIGLGCKTEILLSSVSTVTVYDPTYEDSNSEASS
jgi:hypothetical protein